MTQGDSGKNDGDQPAGHYWDDPPSPSAPKEPVPSEPAETRDPWDTPLPVVVSKPPSAPVRSYTPIGIPEHRTHGFLRVLVAISCITVGCVFLVKKPATLVKTITPKPVATVVVPTPSNCPGTLPQHVRLGERAQINPANTLPIRLRVSPETQGTVLALLKPGTTVEILDGPACASGYLWWRVHVINTSKQGWVAQGNGTVYWLLPAH